MERRGLEERKEAEENEQERKGNRIVKSIEMWTEPRKLGLEGEGNRALKRDGIQQRGSKSEKSREKRRKR